MGVDQQWTHQPTPPRSFTQQGTWRASPRQIPSCRSINPLAPPNRIQRGALHTSQGLDPRVLPRLRVLDSSRRTLDGHRGLNFLANAGNCSHTRHPRDLNVSLVGGPENQDKKRDVVSAECRCGMTITKEPVAFDSSSTHAGRDVPPSTEKTHHAYRLAPCGELPETYSKQVTISVIFVPLEPF